MKIKKKNSWNFVFLMRLLLVAGLAISPSYAASDPSLFTVGGIHVDVVDEAGGAAARQKAHQQAKNTALQELMRRLAPDSQLSQLNKLDPAMTNRWIDGIEVRGERASANRYIAEVTVVFRPEAVEAFLQQKDIAYISVSSPPFVIIPVLNQRGQSLLWGPENIWLSVWQQIEASKIYGLVPVIVPQPFTSGIALSDVEPNLNNQKLAQLAEQYNTPQILVVWAGVNPKNFGDRVGSEIALTAQNVVTGSTQPTPITIRVDAPEGATLEESLMIAARRLLVSMEESWKQKATLNTGAVKIVDVMVPIRGLDEWVGINRSLRAMTEVQKIQMRAITRDVVQLTLEVMDSQGDLPGLFARHQFSLTPGPSIWVLRPAA